MDWDFSRLKAWYACIDEMLLSVDAHSHANCCVFDGSLNALRVGWLNCFNATSISRIVSYVLTIKFSILQATLYFFVMLNGEFYLGVHLLRKICHWCVKLVSVPNHALEFTIPKTVWKQGIVWYLLPFRNNIAVFLIFYCFMKKETLLMKVCKYECLLRHNSYNNAEVTKTLSILRMLMFFLFDAYFKLKIYCYLSFRVILFWSWAR